MCGIFASLSHNTPDLEILKENGLKCQHRGPDETKELYIPDENKNIYMMFHRLAINGLNPESGQPLTINNDNNKILICNGEIYNHKLLAEKYDFQLETESDCEIILHLYNNSSVDFFINELDGVFSFLLFDLVENKITIAHDPFGIRPLYYAHDFNETNQRYLFSSEMKSLVDLSDNVEFYPPGSFSIIEMETYEMFTYSYYDFVYPKILDTEDNIIIKNIRENLTQAVDKRLITDRPLGCLLSGGLDSSIITALVCQKLGAENVRTFAIGLEGSPDLESAQKVADYLGTNHTNVIVSEEEMLKAIDLTIYQIESHDTTTIRASTPMYLLSEYIKVNTDIIVILSGEGSDEASGSYLYFHNAPSPEEFQSECIRLLKDVRYYDVLRGDKTTAGNGLELRVPFFDKTFMQYYMGISPEKKTVRDGMEKYLLRKSFEDMLPEEIVWRRKEGFSDGVSSFEKPWYEIINDYTLDKFGLTEKEYYQNTYDKYYLGHKDIIPYEWLPKWSNEKNPSGRLIK
jgi:asparagine synthase (glutamine-hydrolysing)